MSGRTRKYDYALLEREYVYDSQTPPISFTELADKYGMSRTALTDVAVPGKWHEKRQEVRRVVGEKVLDALTDRWAETESALRRRMLESMVKTLDVYDKALSDEKVRVGPREAMGVVAAIRVLLGDVAAAEAAKDASNIIDVEQTQVDPAEMVKMYQQLKQLANGKEATDGDGADPFAGHARTDAPTGPAGTQQN